jgi:hypothetical protein
MGCMMNEITKLPREYVEAMALGFVSLAKIQPASAEGRMLARGYEVKSKRLIEYLQTPEAEIDLEDCPWPRLLKPAKVGGGRFQSGVSTRLVVEAAQRLYEHEVTPEKEAERVARCTAFVDSIHRQEGSQESATECQPLDAKAPVDQAQPPYKPVKEMRAADWAASLPSSGMSASDLLAIQESQNPLPSCDLAFGRLKELETFERRYKLLHVAIAGNNLSISIDHGNYTQYIDSGAELDYALDDPKSVLRGVQS